MTTKHADKKAHALHVKSADGTHVIAIYNLRVLLSRHSDDEWLAEGLDIDYVIDGTSESDVKTRFEEGLALTIETHLRIHGNIKQLFHVASQDVWDRFAAAVPPDGVQHCPDNIMITVMPERLKQALPRFESIIYANAA